MQKRHCLIIFAFNLFLISSDVLADETGFFTELKDRAIEYQKLPSSELSTAHFSMVVMQNLSCAVELTHYTATAAFVGFWESLPFIQAFGGGNEEATRLKKSPLAIQASRALFGSAFTAVAASYAMPWKTNEFWRDSYVRTNLELENRFGPELKMCGPKYRAFVALPATTLYLRLRGVSDRDGSKAAAIVYPSLRR